MSLDSMKEIFDRMEAEHKPFWEIVLETDMDERQVTRQQSMAKMLTTWQYMVDAADTYTGRRRSVSGLVGYKYAQNIEVYLLYQDEEEDCFLVKHNLYGFFYIHLFPLLL